MSKNKNDFIPEWYHQQAPKGSYRELFKWGDPNDFKAPSKQLYELCKKVFNMTDDDFQERQEMGLEQVDFEAPVNLSDDIRIILV